MVQRRKYVMEQELRWSQFCTCGKKIKKMEQKLNQVAVTLSYLI